MTANVPGIEWLVIGLAALPFLVILAALGIKLSWGYWPILLAVAAAAFAVNALGFDWFWLIALGIAGGLVATWLWQKSLLFLRVDRSLERIMFLGD